MASYYVLNGENIKEDVGGDWDQFAIANEGANAVRRKVIGTRIFDHIFGDETSACVNASLFAINASISKTLDFSQFDALSHSGCSSSARPNDFLLTYRTIS